MAIASKSEQAKNNEIAYRKNIMKNAGKSKPEIDGKGLYLSYRYDVNNGRKLAPDKMKIYEELKKKYER